MAGEGVAVEFRGVSFSYPSRRGSLSVLAGVSLSVPAGRWATVIGPSGCGKTTLLKVGAGLISPDAGVVSIAGGSPAYMPQADTLLPWRDALANALLPAEVAGRSLGPARAEARALFHEFGLAGFERAYPHELSGGMRQRLALMRTLLSHRDVLLLDEPFGGLDALTRASLQEWIATVWMSHRKTILFVTHDVEEAVLLSDQVHVLGPRPARVVATYPIVLPRPRLRTDPRIAAARGEVLGHLSFHD